MVHPGLSFATNYDLEERYPVLLVNFEDKNNSTTPPLPHWWGQSASSKGSWNSPLPWNVFSGEALFLWRAHSCYFFLWLSLRISVPQRWQWKEPASPWKHNRIFHSWSLGFHHPASWDLLLKWFRNQGGKKEALLRTFKNPRNIEWLKEGRKRGCRRGHSLWSQRNLDSNLNSSTSWCVNMCGKLLIFSKLTFS